MKLSGHLVHEHIVVDRVKALFKIHVYGPAIAFLDTCPNLAHGIMS